MAWRRMKTSLNLTMASVLTFSLIVSCLVLLPAVFVHPAFADGGGGGGGDGDGGGGGGGDGGGGSGGDSGGGGGGDHAIFGPDGYLDKTKPGGSISIIHEQMGPDLTAEQERTLLARGWSNVSTARSESPRPTLAALGSHRFPETAAEFSFRPGPPHPQDVAVIIGNADYSKAGTGVPDIMPAHADAEGYRLFATQTLGIAEQNIIRVNDATQAQMVRIFGSDSDPQGQLFDWVKPGQSRVFVFYAGHGAAASRDRVPYLVPVDADPVRVSLNGYSIATLYRNLTHMSAKRVILVMDACFSGLSPAGTLVTRASPLFIEPIGISVPEHLTVVAAGGPGEIASWDEDGRHGLFTRAFLQAISGAADQAPAGNQDGHMDGHELASYLEEHVSYMARRLYGREQHPVVMGDMSAW